MTENPKFYPLEVDSTQSLESNSSPKYVLRSIRLNKDISTSNFYASQIHFMIMVFSFSSGDSLQPLILLDKDFYNIDKNSAGTILSTILCIQLVFKVTTAIIYGHLNDKFGRKIMAFYGISSTFLGFMLAPIWQNVFPGFIFSKLLISNGSTALITLPFNADYVHNDSKGKSTALGIALSSLGAFLSNLCLKGLLYANIPLNYCYWITGTLAFVIMMINTCFLKGGKYFLEKNEDKIKGSSQPFRQSIKQAFQHFKANGWLMIALILQTLGNADFYIVFTILALYIKSLFPPDTDSNVSNITLNNIQTLVLIPALFSNLVYGYCIDTKNKVIECIVFSLAGGALAFFMTFFVSSPYDWELYFAAFVLGTTLTGVYVIANFLGNKHFPSDKRGIMSGVTTLIGYVGYVIIASGGGYLFDHWRNNAPFVIYSGLLTVALASIMAIYYKKIQSEQI